MILITQEQFQQIVDHSLAALPNEGCGLVAGVVEGEYKYVKKIYLLTNTDHSPEHFSMDPKEQFAVIKDIRENGWVLIGNFHSHPSTPARPSEEDKRLAFDSTVSYLILSLQDVNQPVLKSFSIVNGEVKEQTIIVAEG